MLVFIALALSQNRNESTSAGMRSKNTHLEEGPPSCLGSSAVGACSFHEKRAAGDIEIRKDTRGEGKDDSSAIGTKRCVD